MSRQRGRREPPKPEQQAYVESLKKPRRERARERAQVAAGPKGPMIITGRRRWVAVAGGTFFLIFAFGALLNSLLEADAGNTNQARVATGLAGIMALLSIGVVAIGSRGPKPLRSVFLVGPLAVGVFMGLSALLREPATPLVAAFGMAGVIALRPAPAGSMRARYMAVAAGVVVSGLGYLFTPYAAITLAPLLPYFLPMASDYMAHRRAGVKMDEMYEVASSE